MTNDTECRIVCHRRQRQKNLSQIARVQPTFAFHAHSYSAFHLQPTLNGKLKTIVKFLTNRFTVLQFFSSVLEIFFLMFKADSTAILTTGCFFNAPQLSNLESH